MSDPTKYSFDSRSPNWNEGRKDDFARRLQELVEDFNVAHNYGKFNGPFVTTEIQLHDSTDVYNPHTPGVHILNIVNLTEAERRELTAQADALYREIMSQ